MIWICFGVFEMWSSPRITCVIPSQTSSIGDAKLYVGRPSERTSTRSSIVSFATSTRPRTAPSPPVTPSLGTARDSVARDGDAVVRHAEADRSVVMVCLPLADELLGDASAVVQPVELE